MGGFDAAYLAAPADSSKVKYGAGEIRAAKLNSQEVLGVDHYVETSVDLPKHGQHKKVTFADVLTFSPVLAGNESAVYTKDSSGIPAPYFKEGTNEYRVVLGDSNMIAWFYTNVAPIGWVVSTDGVGKVVGIAGGTGEYDVDGGNTAGTYETAHFHASPVHNHQGLPHDHGAGTLRFKLFKRYDTGILRGETIFGAEEVVFSQSGGSIGSGGGFKYKFTLEGFTPEATYFSYIDSGFGDTGTNIGGVGYRGAVISPNANASLRPAAAVGRLFELDV